MIEYLRDPAVPSIIAIVGIIVAVIIYWRQRKRKSLDYEVVSFTPLSSVDPNTLWSYQQAGLQFTFKGETIPQAHFITIKFTNSGNVHIPKEDYAEPISLSFGKKAMVLAFRPVKKKPVDIPVTLKTDGRNVIIDPTLLNPKENFVIEVLVSGFDGKVRIGGRIAGVKEIKDTRGGLPMSREEELVDEAIFVNILILLFAIVQGAFLAAAVAIVILIVQAWRKIVLKLIRHASV